MCKNARVAGLRAGVTLAGPSHVAAEHEIGKIRPDASVHWSFAFHLKMVGNIDFIFDVEVYSINKQNWITRYIYKFHNFKRT